MKVETKVLFLRKEHIEGKNKEGKPYSFDSYYFIDNESKEILLNPPYDCKDNALLNKLSKLEPMKSIDVVLRVHKVKDFLRTELIEIK